MKFIDLFSGIGGFRTGMEMNGHECVAFCEIDKYARQSYKAIYDTEGEEEWHDITKWTDEHVRQFVRDRGHIEVITGGFPCQSFSIAGKRGGFDDTRGTLFFEIMRIANIVRPQYLFLENVKGLLNHDGGATFETILNTLDEFGYDAEWQVLNSKNFGVPQNRERVFIIGHLRGTGGRTVFPVGGAYQSIDIEYIGNTHPGGRGMSGEVYGLNGVSPTLSASDYKDPKKFVQPILTPDRIKKRQNGRRFKEDGEPMFTLTAQDRHGIAIREATKKGYTVAEPGDSVNISFPDSETRRGRVGKQTANTLLTGEEQAVIVKQVEEITNKTRPNEEIGITIKENGDIRPHRMDKRKSGISELNINHENNASHTVTTSHSPKTYGDSTNYRIRKLTPLECWRLQGFTDEQFYKAKNDGVSNSQLYKQAGNSVTVNVIDAIARKLI